MAVDSLPYLMAGGDDFISCYMCEAARVLQVGGDLLVLNYSYRGNIEDDKADIARHGSNAGLAVIVNGVRPFRCWDGSVFHLKRR
jgi:hypothetical protein